jgi:galactokinase
VAGPASILSERFPERFPRSGAPKFYRAPGRVNLIGEHTDYNDGFVLPIAMDLACYTAVAPGSSEGTIRIFSEDLLRGHEWPSDETGDVAPRHDWSDYVVGVARELARRGINIAARDMLIHSTVPVGAGLSSSAALEISSALALSDGAVSADKLELARLGRAAENTFVGMPCGIMDQFISVFGRDHAAIKIDCRSLEYEEVPLPENVAIIAVNTMVKHELGASAYRQRVAECGQAVEYIRRRHPEVKSLRDATLDMITDDMPGLPRKRARHVVSEIQRVQDFAAASRAGDRVRMGELFIASHRSLQHDYEVSCAELDFLVDTAIALPGVFGSRMTGGGFGGCTVSLVAPESLDNFRSAIKSAYQEKFHVEPQMYDCQPSAGAGPVEPA